MANGRLPDFIIIGAMKCGTTSLHKYISHHPQITTSKLKETDFFVEEKNWLRGKSWYERQFNFRSIFCGESSTNYTKFPRFSGVPERMHKMIPKARLIYVLREPLNRIASHYVHNVYMGYETRPIEEALKDPQNNHYVYCSRYYFQIEKYLEYYSPEQLLVTTIEDVEKIPKTILNKILKHIGADDYQWGSEIYIRHNVSTQKLRPNKLGQLILWTSKRFYSLIRSTNPHIIGEKIERPRIPFVLLQEINEIIDEDIEKLSNFLDYPLHEWRKNQTQKTNCCISE